MKDVISFCVFLENVKKNTILNDNAKLRGTFNVSLEHNINDV